MGFFTQKMGLPWIIAFLVIMGEFFGSLGLLAGFLTRFTAASFIVIMLGAIVTTHLQIGFFMNWFGQQQGEGYEYHLLMIGIGLALLMTGAGKMVDRSTHYGEGREISLGCGGRLAKGVDYEHDRDTAY